MVGMTPAIKEKESLAGAFTLAITRLPTSGCDDDGARIARRTPASEPLVTPFACQSFAHLQRSEARLLPPLHD